MTSRSPACQALFLKIREVLQVLKEHGDIAAGQVLCDIPPLLTAAEQEVAKGDV